MEILKPLPDWLIPLMTFLIVALTIYGTSSLPPLIFSI